MDNDAKFTEVTEATIVTLVDGFYARVRRDPLLGPVFNTAIQEESWPAHLQKMYAFWSSVMLTSGRYKGNPVAVHQRVAGMAPPLFANWLDLFEQTADDLFVPELAGEFVTRARRIAESLRLALFFRPDQPWSGDLRNRLPSGGSARLDATPGAPVPSEPVQPPAPGSTRRDLRTGQKPLPGGASA